jgi:hypothetical protein
MEKSYVLLVARSLHVRDEWGIILFLDSIALVCWEMPQLIILDLRSFLPGISTCHSMGHVSSEQYCGSNLQTHSEHGSMRL